jgi:maleate isomerase
MNQEHRKKIGLVSPRIAEFWQPGVVDEVVGDGEYQKMVPASIDLIRTYLPLEEVTAAGLLKMGTYVEEGSYLLAEKQVDVIAFVCTAGSFIKGSGYDKEIIKKIESCTGISAITTTTAVIKALEALKVSRIAIITPYTEEVNATEKAFFAKSGFDIVSMKGLGIKEPREIVQVSPEKIMHMAETVCTSDLEAIFISCTGLTVVGSIQNMEKQFGKPFVTSNQATLWAALGKIDSADSIEGFGRLFEIDQVC